MYRSALLVLSVALASACGGSRPLTATEIDRRADLLTMGGRWDEAHQLIERGLADARSRNDRAAEARLLLRRGHTQIDRVRHSGGDRATAWADLEAAHRGAEAAGDPELLADTIDALGMHRFVHWFSSQDPADLAAADERFRRALSIRLPRGDSGGLSESHFHVGLVHQMRGEHAAAAGEFETSLAVATRLGDELRMSLGTRHLGYLAELRRDWAAAEDHYRRSLELREKVGFGPGTAAAMVTLAELRYMRHGDAEQAVDLLERARRHAGEVGSNAYVAIASAAIGRIERDRGRFDEAVRRLTAAIAAIDEIHSNEDVPANYQQIALIELLRERPAAAVTAVERGIARRSSPRLAALRALAQVRAGLPADPPIAGLADPADPVVTARLALAAGDPAAALTAAIAGDDPDTLLLAARAAGRDGLDRAQVAARAMSPAQQLRFERARAGSAGR